jgi:hypothetical protein
MPIALLAFILIAGASDAVVVPPDHSGTMRVSFDGPPASIRSHQGAVRMDFPRHNGEIESEYDAPGRRSLVITVRKPDGAITNLWIRPQDARLPPGDTDWEDLGPQRTLAGEPCRMQRRTGSNEITAQRCVTSDGVNLLPRREGRLMQMATLARGPVDPADVTPPLELTDPRRWAPPEAWVEAPNRATAGDYVATFAASARTVRRSGDWTLTESKASPPTTALVNETLGLEVRLAGAARDDLWIRRFTPGQRFGSFVFKPDLMKGKAQETVLGEVCAWWSRSTSPDSYAFECRTADGALLAIGFFGMGGQGWEPATSFRREPVALAAILPAAAYFSPEHYGLTPGAPGP